MMAPTTEFSTSELPEVDERLVTPNTRHEIIDGRMVYVPPADEPHGESHGSLAAVIHAHRAGGYAVAVDMLTRTSRIDDIAPDVSVYPRARNATGGRQLEELAFEIASTESLSHAGTKAAKLVARGVRRVFAIDIERDRALEWSKELSQWSILDRRAQIEDPALAVPLPIEALLDAARAADAIPRALRVQRHPEFVAERAEGRVEGRAEGRAEGRDEGRAEALAEAVLLVLAVRGLVPTEAERRRILDERERVRLDRWIRAATSCASVAALLAG
jgi:hypothetical protein